MFYISKRNRRAFGFFAAVALIIIVLPRVVMQFQEKNHFSVEEIEEFKDFKEQRDLFKVQSRTNYKKKKVRFHRPLSKFDPNVYSSKDWQKLGLSPKQADVVLKFSSRGLYSNDDLKKIFVINEDLYNLIKDSTFYPEKPTFSSVNIETKTKPGVAKLWIELNQASSDDLIKLKGIGPFFSKKIIEHRNQLGGFLSKKQLLEVWKFDEEKLSQIEDQIWVDPLQIQKLNINEVGVEILKTHPYISWNVANSIVKMRTQRGSFKSLEEIMDSQLISQDLFVKLKPYLTI